MAPSPVLYVSTTLLVVLALLCTPSLAQTNYSGSILNCPSPARSDETPTSVHKLRPSDIAVIGAMGNSITAGFAVLLSDLSEIATNPTDFRGLSWSGGKAMILQQYLLWVARVKNKPPPIIILSSLACRPSSFLNLSASFPGSVSPFSEHLQNSHFLYIGYSY